LQEYWYRQSSETERSPIVLSRDIIHYFSHRTFANFLGYWQCTVGITVLDLPRFDNLCKEYCKTL